MTNLKTYRNELDKIDNEIFDQIVKRLKIIEKVAKYKIENNIELYHPQREKEMIKNKIKLAKQYNLDQELAEDLMKFLLKYSHKLQNSIMTNDK